MSFADWPWHYWRQEQPHHMALILEGRQLDWSTLCDRVDQLAAGFRYQGLECGDGVAIRNRNSLSTLLAWLALLQCGARVVPLNPQFPDEFLNSLLPHLTLRFALEPEDGSPVPDLPPLKVISSAQRFQANWDPERLASMTLTSGSTGLPKAAAHTFAAHLASAEGVLSRLNFHTKDSWLLSLPLFHVSGQGILWRWLSAGALLVLKPNMPLISALEGCTHASLVPTQLWRLLEQDKQFTLREVLLGGAAIPVELTVRAQEKGLSCWCGYGMTELASTICAKPADNLPDVGTPLLGHDVSIIDHEICIRSKALASGYWHDGQLTPLLKDDGWFHTRDRGEWVDGQLRIIGRLDNLFFSAGEGIQPEDVERVIAAHPAVSQVFIVPIDDAEFGQRPVAIVDITDDVHVEDIQQFLEGKLPRFQMPIRWFILPEQYKSEGIKISRYKLGQWVKTQI